MAAWAKGQAVHVARRLGVRIFDASVIIAVVQDHARRGGDLHSASERIALVPAPEPTRSGRTAIWQFIAAAALAVPLALWLVRWVSG